MVFPDETAAFRGLHALEVLHREGGISVYAAAVVELGTAEADRRRTIAEAEANSPHQCLYAPQGMWRPVRRENSWLIEA